MPEYAQYPCMAERTVLVTGGATGIGASLVEHFAAQRAKVGFVDIDEAAGHAFVDSLSSMRTRPLLVAADLTHIRT